jgi:hypothetical protein
MDLSTPIQIIDISATISSGYAAATLSGLTTPLGGALFGAAVFTMRKVRTYIPFPRHPSLIKKIAFNFSYHIAMLAVSGALLSTVGLSATPIALVCLSLLHFGLMLIVGLMFSSGVWLANNRAATVNQHGIIVGPPINDACFDAARNGRLLPALFHQYFPRD